MYNIRLLINGNMMDVVVEASTLCEAFNEAERIYGGRAVGRSN